MENKYIFITNHNVTGAYYTDGQLTVSLSIWTQKRSTEFTQASGNFL